MITVALLDIYKLMQALMWVFFGVKCVKLVFFSIFHCLIQFLLVPTTLPLSIFFHCIPNALVWASLSIFGRKVWLFVQRGENRRVNGGVHVWLKGLIFGGKIVFSQAHIFGRFFFLLKFGRKWGRKCRKIKILFIPYFLFFSLTTSPHFPPLVCSTFNNTLCQFCKETHSHLTRPYQTNLDSPLFGLGVKGHVKCMRH